MTVDTLSIALELKAAEVPAAQAEAIAAVIGRSAAESLTTAATKADIAQLETKIEQLRSTLMTWFIGTVLTLAAIIIAVVKL